MQVFHAQSELTNGERALRAQTSGAKPFKVVRCRVLRSLDDPQVLLATAFNRRLDQATPVFSNERKRLDDHPFAAGFGQLLPPLDGPRYLLSSVHTQNSVRRGNQQFLIFLGQFAEDFHMPCVVFIAVNSSLTCQQMEGAGLKSRNEFTGQQ